jgi:hypothetical protein
MGVLHFIVAFEVSISAVFALPRGEVLTGILVLGSDCPCMLFGS